MMRNKLAVYYLAQLLVFSTYCNAANILCIFPTPANSYQEPGLVLSHALAARGHSLIVITPNPSPVKVENIVHVNISFLYDEIDTMVKDEKIMTKIKRTGFEMIESHLQMIELLNTRLFDSETIKEFVRRFNNSESDLIIYEPSLFTSLLGLADLTGNPPSIALRIGHGISPIGSVLGNPVLPSYMPAKMSPFTDKMSFWERFQNLFYELYVNYLIEYYIRPINERFMHNNFGNINRALRDLEYETSLCISTGVVETGFAHPVNPNTIYLGPFHLENSMYSVPRELQEWMDKSKDGIIYFSLGGRNISSLPEINHIKEKFIKVFSQFPKLKVLWEWEGYSNYSDLIDNYKTPQLMQLKVDNIFILQELLPKRLFLAHKNVRLFISPTDLNSFEEAVYYGVPVLAIPMSLDEESIAKKLTESGAGLRIDFFSLVYDNLYKKLLDLLVNTSYQENMHRLSLIMKDKPVSPISIAVWWVEYVLRHNGAAHLRPASLYLKWYQFYMLDVIAVFIICVAILFFVFYFIMKNFPRLLIKLTTAMKRGSCNDQDHRITKQEKKKTEKKSL